MCGLPITLAIALYTGELKHLTELLEIPDLNDRLVFIANIMLSGVMGIIITCAVLMVCTICNPLAFNITGKFP